MTTKTTKLTGLTTTETASSSLEVRKRKRKGCRSWLASLLAGACLAQIVITTGLWIPPYEWWLTTRLGGKYPSAQFFDFKIEWCEVGSMYTERCPS